MRSIKLIAAIAIAAAPAAAQAAEPIETGHPTLEEMRAAAAAGDLSTARRLATQIVRDDRDDAADVEALWLMAQIANADGNLRRAAMALDLAAEKAAAYGDPVAQVRSLMEAATLYATARRFDLAAERVAQVRPLMASPHLPEALRAEAATRLHI